MKMNLTTSSVYLGLSVLLTSGLCVNTPIIAAEVLAKTQIAQVQARERKRIAVLDFDFASTSRTGFYYGWYGGIGPAKGVSDLLTDKLVREGTYTVVERSKVEEILKEQNFGASGRVEPSTAAQIGRILGVDAVVIGTITQFNIEESGGNRVCIVVCIGKKKRGAVVQVNSRLVSTSTAEILAAAEGKAEVDKSDTNLRVGVVYENQSNNTDVDALLSTAAESAVTKMLSEIVAAAPKVVGYAAIPNVSAVVADITGNQITINKGTENGFTNGMKLSIERVVKKVKDPQTGNVLRTITSPVGRIELTEVSNGYATGKIISGKGFKIGDIAKAVP